MILIEKREKIDETNTRKSFNENFYTGDNNHNRIRTYRVEPMRKTLNEVALTTNRTITNTNEPLIRVNTPQIENFFNNDNMVVRMTNFGVKRDKEEYKVVQRNDPLELVLPRTYYSGSFADKSGTQFNANRTDLRKTEVRSYNRNTRSELPFSETEYEN